MKEEEERHALEPAVRRICSNCVGEELLKEVIQTKGTLGRCSYCSQDGMTIAMEEMADRIATAFEQHFERTPSEPSSLEHAMMSDKESAYEWKREGEPIVCAIAKAAVVGKEPAMDVQKILKERIASDPTDWSEEEEFGDDSYYRNKTIPDPMFYRSRLLDEWAEFERSLRTESRYFSEKTNQHLTNLFGRVGSLVTEGGRSLIELAGPDTDIKAFFRARVCETGKALDPVIVEPAKEVGPPPPELARNGRMNAPGISVFYGASDSDTALAEVRPPVGSRVVVAKFDLVRPVRLLNIGAFAKVSAKGSIFDQEFAGQQEHARFVRDLVNRLTMPVMPSNEAFAYLATQVIAEFLAANGPELDGLLFPSVQTGGTNVVLFQRASRVKSIELPEGTKLYVDRGHFNGEKYEAELTVVEEVPPKRREKKKQLVISEEMFRDFVPPPRRDFRQVTLKVDLESVVVRVVKKVSFETGDEQVGRRRVNKVMPERSAQDSVGSL